MAKIFPNTLDERIRNDPKKRAEVRVFDGLKSSKLPSSTKIYYSVDWINQNTDSPRIDGECDFIISDPDWGIIFLEIKGGFITKDENNIWYQNGRQLTRSPLQQAKISTYEIINEFKKKNMHSDYDFFYSYFAIFPDSSKEKFRANQSISFIDDQFGFNEDMENLGKLVFNFFSFRPPGAEHFNHKKLGETNQQEFHKMFTSPLNLTPSLNKIIINNSFRIKELTINQKNLINRTVGDWRRLCIEGPAGSGKTSIAVEKFLNEAAQFENPIFLCRGKKLCSAINSSHSAEVSVSQIFNFDKFLVFLAKKYSPDLINFKNFRNSTRRNLINGLFDKSEIIDKIDFLIVDESQDFEDSWWSFIESILSKDAFVWTFGDSNQNIWKNTKPEIFKMSEPFHLTEILRNSHQIATKSLIFFDGGGRNISISGPHSEEICISKFSKIDDIKKEISRLISIEGISTEEITVLFQDKINPEFCKPLNNRIIFSDELSLENNCIHISSILNYKGLESDCIFLVLNDIAKISQEELYVGSSRARHFLKVFTTEDQYESTLKVFREYLD